MQSFYLSLRTLFELQLSSKEYPVPLLGSVMQIILNYQDPSALLKKDQKAILEVVLVGSYVIF